MAIEIIVGVSGVCVFERMIASSGESLRDDALGLTFALANGDIHSRVHAWTTASI